MMKYNKKNLAAVALSCGVALSIAAPATAQSVTETGSAQSTVESTTDSFPTLQGAKTDNSTDSSSSSSPSSSVESSSTTQQNPPMYEDIVATASLINMGDSVKFDMKYKGLSTGKTYTLVVKTQGDKSKTSRFTFSVSSRSEGEKAFSVKGLSEGDVLSAEIINSSGNKVSDVQGVNGEKLVVGETTAPSIRTSADMNTDVIQTGSTVKDTVRYKNLEAGEQYTLETRLVCTTDAEQTGDVVKTVFTPEASEGDTVVENIAVKNPDCLEQVVFEKLYDKDGSLVAVHEDIDDKAQTVGGERDGKKKKKKDSEGISSVTPSPDTAASPGVAVGAGAPTLGERATIGSVPSGALEGFGYTLFS